MHATSFPIVNTLLNTAFAFEQLGFFRVNLGYQKKLIWGLSEKHNFFTSFRMSNAPAVSLILK